jgi:hypothetical protein
LEYCKPRLRIEVASRPRRTARPRNLGTEIRFAAKQSLIVTKV